MIDFKKIPQDWEVKRIGKMTKTLAGGTPSTSNVAFWGGEIKWMSSGELNFKKVYEVEGRITELGLKSSSTRILPLYCVLIGLAGQGKTRGTVAMNMIELCTNQSVAAILPAPDFSEEYLYYNLEFRYDELRQLSTGDGGRGGLNLNIINSVQIPLPPLSEQRAIAKVLSAADAAIHATEKLIAQKELRKKWLMQQLLTGKKRLKGFEGEWKEVPLGEMFAERNETKYFDLHLLSIGQNGVYPQDESVKKDTSNEDKSKYKRICPGDIGYNTMRMWQGRSALSGLEGIVSPAYTVVTPKKNADSLFFSYLFKMPKMTNLFWRNSQGLVDDTLNCKFKDFSIVKVMLPQSKEEQTAIAQVLQTADKEISLLKAKAEKFREQKKGLMQQLLTGRVRLKIK